MVTVSELNSLRRSAGFARYVHTNLHMHTPATPWDWNPRNPTAHASSLTVEQYFESLNGTSLELVAITDHNTVNWCEPLIALAKAGRKAGTSKLHILPGVEITTYEGPHLLAIFDEDTPVEKLRKMLYRLGMSGDGNESDRVDCESGKEQHTIQDVISIVADDYHGLVVAPHVHSAAGIWGAKGFRGRTKILNNPQLRVLAAGSGDIKRVVEPDGRTRYLYKTMDTTQILNSFAFINVSDCHKCEDFELDTTWIKMCTPSLEGVRQIIYEPEMRISHRIVDTGSGHEFREAFEFVPPQEAAHPHLLGLAVTGGMLNGQMVAFSPHQNCVIGKNYSGKSSLLDCLRFVLNALPTDDGSRSRLISRLNGIIGEGGEVRLYFQNSEGEVFGLSRVLTRTASLTRAKENWTLEGRPEVFRYLSGEFVPDHNLSNMPLMGLEIYPQGEVVKIKDNVSQQMRIVDSLAKVEQGVAALSQAEHQGEMTIRGKLVDNSEKISKSQTLIDKLGDSVAGIAPLQDEISRLESLAASPRLSDLALWGNVRGQVNTFKNRIETLASGYSKQRKENISNLSLFDQSDGSVVGVSTDGQGTHQDIAATESASNLAPEQTLVHAAAIYKNTIAAIQESLTSAEAEAKNGVASLQDLLDRCEDQYAQVRQTIQEVLGAGSNENAQIVLLDRIEQKRQQLRLLEDDRKKLTKAHEELKALNNERASMLSLYYDAWKTITDERRKVVALINQDSADNIQAELVEESDADEFYEMLEDVADALTSSANRISNKQAQLSLICNTLHPQQLLELIVAGDVGKLTEAVPGLKENTARILMGMGVADTHFLQLCVLHDRFLISYRREGDGDFTPIDAGLSGGEQALALLSVAMVRKPLPLVIDQPEDELGQALIAKDLVESIRKAKVHRQLIFVTHVPNIPVLADSEQIIYMRQTRADGNTRLCVDRTGSLDCPDVINCLLELDGGRVAIEKRYQRYAPLLLQAQN